MLLEQFQRSWQQLYKRHGDTVLLAVSGGEDSMVMAHLFLHSKIEFAIAHCNFGLRGEEADKDEQFVHDWCKKNSIKFHSVKFDTKHKAEEWKKGTQETARILRYEWFELIRQQHHYAKIVTAHHANDNAETLLINLFKGTGITGLHGIPPENGYIIRPLLFAGKDMISAYCAANNITFREDASNASDDYLRNAVRHHIVPAVQQWFPGAVPNLTDSIRRFSEAEILYRKAIEQERKKLVEQRGSDYYIPVRKLVQHEPLNTICYELLHPFDFTSAQVPHVLQLLESQSGHYVASGTHRIIRNRDFLIITTIPTETADFVAIEGAPCIVNTGRHIFKLSVQAVPPVIPKAPDEVYLNLDEIVFPILLRKWRAGDYFYPFGMGMKKKKVSRLLVDEKIPLHEKEHVRILECNKRIAWVSGIRIDERFRVKNNTEKVLVVKRETVA